MLSPHAKMHPNLCYINLSLLYYVIKSIKLSSLFCTVGTQEDLPLSIAHAQSYIEKDLGFTFDTFPDRGIDIRVSPVRTDDGNALLIIRHEESAVATGTSRVVAAIEPVIKKMDIWTLFSLYGKAELERGLESEQVKVRGGSFHHALTVDRYCAPEQILEPVVKLVDDTRPDDSLFDRKWMDAFAVYKDGEQVALTQVRWKTPDLIEIAVDTHKDYRKRGYGFAVVSQAAEWIFAQGAVVHYPVMPGNIASMRIIRKLGGVIAWQEIYG